MQRKCAKSYLDDSTGAGEIVSNVGTVTRIVSHVKGGGCQHSLVLKIFLT